MKNNKNNNKIRVQSNRNGMFPFYKGMPPLPLRALPKNYMLFPLTFSQLKFKSHLTTEAEGRSLFHAALCSLRKTELLLLRKKRRKSAISRPLSEVWLIHWYTTKGRLRPLPEVFRSVTPLMSHKIY